jgi:hypothetical protein
VRGKTGRGKEARESKPLKLQVGEQCSKHFAPSHLSVAPSERCDAFWHCTALHCTTLHRDFRGASVFVLRADQGRAQDPHGISFSYHLNRFVGLTPSQAPLTSFFPAEGPASTQPDLMAADAEEQARTGAPSRSDSFQIGKIYPGSLSALPHISDFLLVSTLDASHCVDIDSQCVKRRGMAWSLPENIVSSKDLTLAQ